MDGGLGAKCMPLTVARAEEIAEAIHLFELRSPDGGELPEFTAGSHLAVQTPSGLLRKYSLCNDPAERDRYVIAVRREDNSRGGSASMAASVQPGHVLRVAPPHNNFSLVPSPGGYTFIAGGIGITPIMSMIHVLRQDPAARFRLFYLTRSPSVTAFRDELAAPELKNRVTMHHDEGIAEQAYDLWPALEQPRGHIYCCGPRGLLESVRDMTGHWPPAAIHFEAFGESDTRKADDRPFRVKLARSGATIDVPAGMTILEALRANGFDASSSCESGSCGTCRTRLLAGEADHRDLVLGPHEQQSQIMICVSRAHSDMIEIDL